MRGTPAFIAGGKRDINKVFDNIKAQPTNFEADSQIGRAHV